MYTNFQTSFYSREPNPYLSKSNFLEFATLIVIDGSKQNEFLKSGPVDIRSEFEAKRNVPA